MKNAVKILGTLLVLALIYIGVRGFILSSNESSIQENILTESPAQEITETDPSTIQSSKPEEDFFKNTNLQENREEIQDELIPTPSQTEGPYYPLTKPSDRDENLRLIENSSEFAAGTPIKVYGKLVDANGAPQPSSLIEIWQADDQGIYDHPGDPKHDQKDKNFQSYGEYITDEGGNFYFETILPGHYSTRPRHIHLRVKDSQKNEILTTQLYFHGDQYLETDGVFNRTKYKELLVMKLFDRIDSELTYKIGEIDIRLDR